MKTLFVAWQSPTERSWFTVGRLRSRGERFRFDYTHGVEAAGEVGFRPFSAFPDLHVSYESERLFPFFANRLLSRSRREYEDFVRWVSPHELEDDPVALLARSGGTRMTDSLELYPQPEQDNGWYHLHFFVHGLSHLPAAAANRAEQLQEGEHLLILKDVQNPQDRNALVLRTEERNEQDFFFMGFVPRYLAQDVAPILEESSARATVVRLNPPPTPIQFRILCCFRIRPPAGHRLFRGREFLPINEDAPSPASRRTRSRVGRSRRSGGRQ